MTDIVDWPRFLSPETIEANVVPFTRSGGPSLDGNEIVTRTDRGRWMATMRNIPLHGPERRRVFNAIRTKLGGRAGLVAVPIWSNDTAPYPIGTVFPSSVPYDDGSTFDDGTTFLGSAIHIRMAAPAALGATIVTLRIVEAAPDLAGVRFSYNRALYETGPAISVVGDQWQVPVFPAIRAAIPNDARLEFDRPTCLMHLATDREMDAPSTWRERDLVSVSFTEAVDYWSDLAAG